MKRLLRTYLPSSAIAFTVVILFNSIYNLIFWGYRSLDTVFVLTLAGLIILIQLGSALCDRVPFRTKKAYMATFFTLEYLLVLAASFIWNGRVLTVSAFLYTTVVFVFTAFLIGQYFTAVHRHEAEEINRLLDANGKKEEQLL